MNVREIIENRVIASKLNKITSTLHDTRARKYMISKMPSIAKIAKPKKFKRFITELLKYPDGIDAVKNKFDEIKSGCLENDHISTSVVGECGIDSFFRLLDCFKDVPELQDEYELYDFFRKIYNDINPLQGLSWFSAYVDRGQREYLKQNIFKKILGTKYCEDVKNVLQYVSQGNECKFYAMGATSFVFKAGDQVIKLGDKFDFEVPYHPRLMMPYFRQKYETGVSVEVFNFANVGSAASITQEQLLEIYKELEDAGIFWGDAKIDNLGILLKPNCLPDFIASEEFNVFGFLKDDRFPTTSHKTLPEGSVVVCDLDFLYAKNDPNLKIGNPAAIIWRYWKSRKRLQEIRNIQKNIKLPEDEEQR